MDLMHDVESADLDFQVAQVSSPQEVQTRSRSTIGMAAVFWGWLDLHEANDGVGLPLALVSGLTPCMREL
jgi:hypothetical protein